MTDTFHYTGTLEQRLCIIYCKRQIWCRGTIYILFLVKFTLYVNALTTLCNVDTKQLSLY